MARVRNVVGIVADVSDAEATRLQKYGWESVEAPAKEKADEKPKATRRRSAAKSDEK